MAASSAVLVLEETTKILTDLQRSWRVLWALTVIEAAAGTPARSSACCGIRSIRRCCSAAIASSTSSCSGPLQGVRHLRVRAVRLLRPDPVSRFQRGGATSAIRAAESGAAEERGVPDRVRAGEVRVCRAVGLISSLAILMLMMLPTLRGWHLLYLPVAVAGLFLFGVIVAWILSGSRGHRPRRRADREHRAAAADVRVADRLFDRHGAAARAVARLS